MRTHLRVNYGCDRRFFILHDTLRVSHNFFDTIRIVTACSDEDHAEAMQFEQISPKIKVERFPTPWYGDMEPLFRNLTWDVPENDWIHFLDSDERPTYDFLLSMGDMIGDAEKEGVNLIRIPSIHHLVHQHHSPTWTQQSYKAIYAAAPYTVYSEPSLFKFNRRQNYFVSCYGGGHTMPCRMDKKEKYWTKPTLHFKNPDNWRQAIPLQGFFSPSFHSGELEFIEMRKSKEFADFQRIKDELQCYTSTQFMHELTHKTEKIEKFREVFLTFKDSPHYQFKKMYEWASETEMSKANEKPDFCGHKCCNYGAIQL